MNQKDKHWYRIYICECPVCLRSEIFRERVYGEKPTNPDEIYFYEIVYDWCDY